MEGVETVTVRLLHPPERPVLGGSADRRLHLLGGGTRAGANCRLLLGLRLRPLRSPLAPRRGAGTQ
eukprot:13812567-Alexandrium_andersonii.AAC.1